MSHEFVLSHRRDALIAFIAATAQSQAEATKESQKAGIEHAKAAQDGRYLGRKPSHSREQYQAVFDMLAQGAGIGSIA
jgi:DNA invertase Pin-like site-specific DNA recombinase